MNNALSKTELTHIKEGMKVLDVNGDKVGKVDSVRFGDENYEQPGVETTKVNYGDNEDTYIDIIAQVYDPIDIPEEIQARMYRHGFLSIDSGFLKKDRYVLLSDVARISEDEVYLSIAKDELFHIK